MEGLDRFLADLFPNHGSDMVPVTLRKKMSLRTYDALCNFLNQYHHSEVGKWLINRRGDHVPLQTAMRYMTQSDTSEILIKVKMRGYEANNFVAAWGAVIGEADV